MRILLERKKNVQQKRKVFLQKIVMRGRKEIDGDGEKCQKIRQRKHDTIPEGVCECFGKY